MKYLIEKDDILSSVTWDNFTYETSQIKLLDYSVKVLIIKISINNQEIEMQPILMESIEYVDTVMEQLWIKQNSSNFQLPQGRLSLKTDVVFSYISKNINKGTSLPFLDIGYSNDSLYKYLLKNNPNVIYSGLDLVNSDDQFPSKIGSATNIPFNNDSFDIVNLSML